jgi:hypothetical protein
MQTTSARPVGRAAAALAELVRFRTVSSRTASEVDAGEFEGFIAALARLYPSVHAGLDLERVNGHALLYRWPGTGAERPIVPPPVAAFNLETTAGVKRRAYRQDRDNALWPREITAGIFCVFTLSGGG